MLRRLYDEATPREKGHYTMYTNALRHPTRYTVAATTGDAARPWVVLAPLGVSPCFAGDYEERAKAVRRATYLNVASGR
jgi:hypothetical protein